jgi:hypothetical protein
MARTKSAKAGKPAGPYDLNALAQSRDQTTAQHFRSANTTSTYEGHIKRGREWISSGAPASNDSSGLLAGGAGPGSGREKWEMDVFVRAFDDTPNEHSPEALSLYIHVKCVDQGCKKSTAEQIHAAFKAMWEKL